MSSLLPPPPDRPSADAPHELTAREWQEAEAELPVLTEVLDGWQALPVLDIEAPAEALSQAQPLAEGAFEPLAPAEPWPLSQPNEPLASPLWREQVAAEVDEAVHEVPPDMAPESVAGAAPCGPAPAAALEWAPQGLAEATLEEAPEAAPESAPEAAPESPGRIAAAQPELGASLSEVALGGFPDLSDALPAMAGLHLGGPQASPIDAQAVSQQVLLGVQRHLDAMLEFRLRQSLQPILEKMAAAMVAELREELSHTLKDVVSRAVAQEVSRHRSR